MTLYFCIRSIGPSRTKTWRPLSRTVPGVVAVVGAVVHASVELASWQLCLHQLAGGISWDLLVFVFSLFFILRGGSHSGLTEWTQTLLVQPGLEGVADVPGMLYLRIGLITVPLLLISSVFGLWLAI